MFYEQFITICQLNGEKPTNILKELDLSPGNLSRWKNGSSVNSDILSKLSERFNVPVDYFFQDNNQEIPPPGNDNANGKQYLYYLFKAHGELLSSTLNGRYINAYQLKRISLYTRYPETFFYPKSAKIDDSAVLYNSTDNELIIGIMSKAAANKEYRYFQVQLSRIIITNLEKIGFNKQSLIDLKLYKKKIDDLYNHDIEPSSCIPLNCSDLYRINENLGVSFTYMFTGHQ